MTTHVYQNSRTFVPEDYAVHEADFAKLDNPRPLGLTGHLRVRDEAISLRACLDSCLPFLDELIITYNDSIDETEEILLEYATKYPQKIRLFWYPLEYSTRNGKEALVPLGHLSSFYNYGYTKTSYHYYMKIDADQVYFTEKMCLIREIFCSQPKQKRTWETLPHWWIQFLKTYQKNKARFAKIFSQAKREESYADIIKKGLRLKQPVSFKVSGINIFYTHDTLVALSSISPFNGYSGDTVIFSPSSLGRYLMRNNRNEAFRLSYPVFRIPLGFTWIHTGPIKHKSLDSQHILCSLNKIAQQPWDKVKEHSVTNSAGKNIKPHLLKTYIELGQKFWEKDIHTYFTPEFYNMYFPSIINYLQRNYQNTVVYSDILRGITKK